jgi:hypothetical protein
MTRRPNQLKPGVYPDLSLEEYLAICDSDGWPAVSNTLLRAARHGGRECQHQQRHGIKPTKSLLTGSLTHIQILRPEDWLTRVVVWDRIVEEPLPALQWDKMHPGRYVTKCGSYELVKVGGVWQPITRDGYCPDEYSTIPAAKAACKQHYETTTPRQPKLDEDGNPKLSPMAKTNGAFRDFVAANPGREPVTPADIEAAKRIARAVRDNSEARRRLGQMWRTEYTIVWRDAETGVLMKCRHDWLTDPRGHLVTLGELKTCRSAEEGAWTRQAADMEYHCQAAHYRAGFRAHFRARDEGIESVCLAVENSGSHDSCVYTWQPKELNAGAAVNAERLQQLLAWREHGDEQWPCRREAAHVDFGAHGRGGLLDDAGHLGGPKVDFGDIPR